MTLPTVIVWLPVALVTAVAMDLWAALLHGKVWHRLLWFVHVSHHTKREGIFEHNDALSVLHAPIAIAFVLYGCAGAPGVLREVLFGIGIGASAFGLAYFVVHDGLVHGRLPVRFLLRLAWLRAVVRAHRVHHVGVKGQPPYGLFFGPLELARAAKRNARTAHARNTSRTKPMPQRPTASGPSPRITSPQTRG